MTSKTIFHLILGTKVSALSKMYNKCYVEEEMFKVLICLFLSISRSLIKLNVVPSKTMLDNPQVLHKLVKFMSAQIVVKAIGE